MNQLFLGGLRGNAHLRRAALQDDTQQLLGRRVGTPFSTRDPNKNAVSLHDNRTIFNILYIYYIFDYICIVSSLNAFQQLRTHTTSTCTSLSPCSRTFQTHVHLNCSTPLVAFSLPSTCSRGMPVSSAMRAFHLWDTHRERGWERDAT